MTSIRAEAPLSNLAHVGFLTLPSFSMIAFTSAVEVLRMANYVSRAQHYRWSVITTDGVPVRASNGLTVKPTRTLEEAGMPDVLIVCGGTQIRNAVDTNVKTLLAEAASQGVPLGGICTGAYALMAAGLLDGYRCSVHWEDLSALHKEYPHVQFADELFVIDRDRVTCTGGTAPLDLMLDPAATALNRLERHPAVFDGLGQGAGRNQTERHRNRLSHPAQSQIWEKLVLKANKVPPPPMVAGRQERGLRLRNFSAGTSWMPSAATSMPSRA